MKNLFAVTLLIFFSLSPLLQASETTLLIERADKAYNEGLYAEAAELYSRVDHLGYRSPGLYYNIGNAFFKMNNFPAAILWYERALRLAPGNEDIQYNLKVANSRISDKIEPLPDLFYIRWYKSIVTSMTPDRWAWTMVALFFTSLLMAALYYTSRILIVRKTAFWTGFAALILSLTFLIMAYSSRKYLDGSNEAIVFSPVVTVKSSPGEKSVDLFVIHEGTKVILREKIGDWCEIRLANGSVGWVPVTSLEVI